MPMASVRTCTNALRRMHSAFPLTNNPSVSGTPHILRQSLTAVMCGAQVLDIRRVVIARIPVDVVTVQPIRTTTVRPGAHHAPGEVTCTRPTVAAPIPPAGRAGAAGIHGGTPQSQVHLAQPRRVTRQPGAPGGVTLVTRHMGTGAEPGHTHPAHLPVMARAPQPAAPPRPPVA